MTIKPTTRQPNRYQPRTKVAQVKIKAKHLNSTDTTDY